MSNNCPGSGATTELAAGAWGSGRRRALVVVKLPAHVLARQAGVAGQTGQEMSHLLGLQLLAFNIFQEHAGSAGADQVHGNSDVSDPEFLNMQFYRFAVYTHVGEVTAGFQQSTSDFCPGPLNTKAFISKVFLD